MPRIITFGEIMLRLSPPGFERLLQSPLLVATFGGGEANVAVSLAHLGLESVYVTALPKNAIGDAAVRALRAEGVVTDRIVRSGDRVGIYFAETGASQRASTVLYDRANSAISQMAPDAVDWASVMRGADWLHVTGITPALGERGTAATARAIAAAKSAGAQVSVDLNYRKKLWSEAKAREVMGPMMRDVDVVIANEEDLQSVLGVHVPGTDVTAGQLNLQGFRDAVVLVKSLVPTLTLNAAGCPNNLTDPQVASVRTRLTQGAQGTLAGAPCAQDHADCFKHLRVMAIVLQVDKSLLLDSGHNVVAVWGSTHMGS